MSCRDKNCNGEILELFNEMSNMEKLVTNRLFSKWWYSRKCLNCKYSDLYGESSTTIYIKRCENCYKDSKFEEESIQKLLIRKELALQEMSKK